LPDETFGAVLKADWAHLGHAEPTVVEVDPNPTATYEQAVEPPLYREALSPARILDQSIEHSIESLTAAVERSDYELAERLMQKLARLNERRAAL